MGLNTIQRYASFAAPFGTKTIIHEFMNKCRVEGTVAPGFESVEKLFKRNVRKLAEGGTQLCVYRRGEKVVDLWSSANAGEQFDADSLINVFSSGKNFEAIALGWLVGKGLLDYDAKIIDYWPEFGANGKEQVTVAELMRHEAGLASFNTPIKQEDLLTKNIKKNKVGEIIEQHPQSYEVPGSSNKREYHALTRGWIVNEIFRRVDPAGRTIGEFLREEISTPLEVDAFIGISKKEQERASKIIPLSLGYQLIESLKPKLFGRKITHSLFEIMHMFDKVPRNRRNKPAQMAIHGIRGIEGFNRHRIAAGETSSAAANCSARGLAKIAAMMSAGGKFDDKEYLPEKAWAAMHDKPVEALLEGFMPSRFTQGGVDQYTKCTQNSTRLERNLNEGREGFYGWMGMGGSIFQWHPELDIGFAFIPTSLHSVDFLNERGKVYQAEVLRCISLMPPTSSKTTAA